MHENGPFKIPYVVRHCESRSFIGVWQSDEAMVHVECLEVYLGAAGYFRYYVFTATDNSLYNREMFPETTFYKGVSWKTSPPEMELWVNSKAIVAAVKPTVQEY